ncbi:hypothetical protein ACFORL_07590 [Legionella dresdenensis]|uniref:Coiled-coil protein n=1 Tax=Legionella dresdenensis TaxID=450200 RepID=A0ABV8CFS0_9GAMM
MISQIQLSSESIALIKQLTRITSSLTVLSGQEEQATVERRQLCQWLLTAHAIADSERYLWEGLMVALLRDLAGNNADYARHTASTWRDRLKFLMLAFAGIIVLGCEGFDGITSILNLFMLPASAIFSVGLVFSILSIAVFFAFDFLELSRNLGFRIKHTPHMLELYQQQTALLKGMRKQLGNSLYNEENIDKLRADKTLLDLLRNRQTVLDEVRAKLRAALNNNVMNIIKMITAAAIGVFFRFGGGFFAGQAVAMSIAALCSASVSPTFLPIILACTTVGLASFIVYWFLERPAIEGVIGRWIGYEKEKIEEICDEGIAQKEKDKLIGLSNYVEQKIAKYDAKPEPMPVIREQGIALTAKPVTLKRSLSANSFFKLKTQDDNSDAEMEFIACPDYESAAGRPCA